MSRVQYIVLFIVSFGAVADSGARTMPSEGGVSLPSGINLRIPLTCGVSTSSECAYGCNYHQSKNISTGSNDYYAIDLGIATSAPHDIVAIADGRVVFAGWATGGYSTYGRIVVIQHNFGDGHSYMSLYAHLASWITRTGDSVKRGQRIAVMGNSGSASFSVHLHFALYRNATFNADRSQGSVGPRGGQSVVPEPFGGYENIRRGWTGKVSCTAADDPTHGGNTNPDDDPVITDPVTNDDPSGGNIPDTTLMGGCQIAHPVAVTMCDLLIALVVLWQIRSRSRSRKKFGAIVLAAAAALSPIHAVALTPINTNAAVLPANEQLRLPLPCGTRYVVTYGYHTHYTATRINSPTQTNDYYAVDFAYYQTSSLNKPAQPITYGTVRYAGWSTAGYGNTIVVEHLLSDGQTYHSMYTHLNSVSVSVGQAVTPDSQIGLIGTTGNSTGPHLHFALIRGGTVRPPNSGWPIIGGVAVLPEKIDGLENIVRYMLGQVACNTTPVPPRAPTTPQPVPPTPVPSGTDGGITPFGDAPNSNNSEMDGSVIGGCAIVSAPLSSDFPAELISCIVICLLFARLRRQD